MLLIRQINVVTSFKNYNRECKKETKSTENNWRLDSPVKIDHVDPRFKKNVKSG